MAQTLMKTHRLAIEDVARLLGTGVNDIPKECQNFIGEHDFRYRIPGGDERDRIVVHILRKIDSGELTVSGKAAKPRWEMGWSENLKNFIAKNHDISELIPRYVKSNQPMRLFGEYVLPIDANFEVNWYTVFRTWFFGTYLGNLWKTRSDGSKTVANCSDFRIAAPDDAFFRGSLKDSTAIYEFGCGSGYNLPILAKLFPKTELHGLDWVAASRDIVNALAQTYGWNMAGHIFDMFAPSEDLKMKKGSAALTMGGLEQLGEHYHKFLEYLLQEKPAICAHMEPLIELYNPHLPFDAIAIRFHRKRGYLGNFLNTLKALESEGTIEILKIQRVRLGSLYHEGYSFVVWRPKGV